MGSGKVFGPPGLTLIAFDPTSIAVIVLIVASIAFPRRNTLGRPCRPCRQADPVTSRR